MIINKGSLVLHRPYGTIKVIDKITYKLDKENN